MPTLLSGLNNYYSADDANVVAADITKGKIAYGSAGQVIGTNDLVILDRFQGPDMDLQGRTPDQVNLPGNTWVSQDWDAPYDGSKFTITSRQTAIAGASEIVNGIIESDISDVIIDVDLVLNGNAAHGSQGLIFRYVDRDNFWLMNRTSSTGIALNEVVAGSSTARDSAVVTLSNSSLYHFQLVASGADLTGYLDGTAVLSYSSAVHQTNTKHGIIGVGFTSGGDTNHRLFMLRNNS